MAYVFQIVTVGQVLTAAIYNQTEVNVRDHEHGAAGVVSTVTLLRGTKAAATTIFATRVTADTFDRIAVMSDAIEFGPGTTATELRQTFLATRRLKLRQIAAGIMGWGFTNDTGGETFDLGKSGSAGDWMTGAVAGDIVLRAMGGRLLLGANATVTTAPTTGFALTGAGVLTPIGGAVLGTDTVPAAAVQANAITPVKLNKAQASASAVCTGGVCGDCPQGAVAAVQQFAFASPAAVGSQAATNCLVGSGGANSPGFGGIGFVAGTTTLRQWRIVAVSGGNGANTCTFTWDYLTASGNPKVWVIRGLLGDIVASWEGEDPADKNNPDAPALAGTVPLGGSIVAVQWPPSVTVLAALLVKMGITLSPAVITRWKTECRERLLAELNTSTEAYALADPLQRRWYLQLLMRETMREIGLPASLSRMLVDFCRVDAAGVVSVKP